MGNQCVRDGCSIKRDSTTDNIPLVYELPEILKGWEGQPKGMLQVLWGRGFIDGTKSEKYYTLEGCKDESLETSTRQNFLQDDDGTTNGFY
jgi:hypothetical protein